MKDKFGAWLRRLAYQLDEFLEQRAIKKNVREFERSKIDEDAGQSKARKKSDKRRNRN
ncbi:hypothetical protein [Vibrio phage VCPH]|nr:hypothetical protein [Vibrio phage VCPH]